MFGRRKQPDALAGLRGRPLAVAELEGDPPRWLAVYEDELATGDGQAVFEYAWHEFEGAAWDGATRTLRLSFVDSSRTPLVLVWSEEARDAIALIVRERLEGSIVYQEHVILPSGTRARGLVRRDGDSLFTQVIIAGQSLESDRPEIAHLEASLRDVTGIDLDDALG